MRTGFLLTTIALSFLPLSSPAQKPVTEGKPARSIGIEQQRGDLVGRWYGTAPTRTGGQTMWLDERKEDGTFVITFRIKKASGEILEQIEKGEWGVTGNQLVTITRARLEGGEWVAAKSALNYFWDVYWVDAFDGKEFKYTNQATGNSFTAKKVFASFDLPPFDAGK